MQKSTRQRREEIERMIQEEVNVRVEFLSQHFQVTKETIRTDLQYLENKGSIHRTHGGALRREGQYDVPFEIRHSEHVYEKRQLARKALEYIHDDSLIYIDPSSTAIYLGVLLKSKRNITIVTNALGILPYLEGSGHRVILTGGEYSFSGKRMGSAHALKIISTMYFDLCIMGMDGCKGIDGPANIPDDEIIVNKTVIGRSAKKMLIAEPRKFDSIAHHQYAKFSEFDYLISGKLKEEDKKRCDVKNIIEIELKEK